MGLLINFFYFQYNYNVFQVEYVFFFPCRINTGRNLTEIIPKSRDLWPPPLIRSANSMNQDSSFNQQSGASFHESDSFPNSHSSTTAEDSYLLSKRYYDQYYLGEGNLWHTNFSNIANNNMAQLQLSSSGDLYTNIADHDHHSPCLGTSAAASRSYDLNHIFPSTTSYLSSTLFSSSLDLNLKTLDLLTSTYDGGISCNNQSLIDSHGKLSRSLMSHDHRRERRDSPSTSYKVGIFLSYLCFLLFFMHLETRFLYLHWKDTHYMKYKRELNL